jgi:uncharacterized protein YodC (DUF2158 family)
MFVFFFIHAFFNRFHFILTNIRLYFNNVLNLKHFAKALSFKKVFSCMSLFLVLFSSSQDGFSQGTNHKVTFGQKNSASYDILLEGTKTNTYLVNNTKAAIIPPTSCLPSNGYIAKTLSEDYPRQYHEKTAKIDDFKIERGSEVVLQSNKLLAAPTNDLCTNATALTVNLTTTCSTSTSGTTLSASQSTLGCAGFADDDVWYTFVATAASHIVTVTPSTLTDAVFQVYSGTCAAVVSIICIDDTGSTSNETTTLTGLTIGNTYLVRVYSYSNGSDQGTFSICVTTPCNYGSITSISGFSSTNHVVISQVYGGGGLAGATYKNDFVELFNPTNAAILLNGSSLQYASTSGTSWTNKVNLSGTIASGGYFLIQLFAESPYDGAALPTTPNLPSTSINMAHESGKIALINNQITIATGLSYPPLASIIDFVGYGSANSFEGNAAAPILTRVLANYRKYNGCIDTDNNLSDFSVANPNPRNSASPTNSCTVNTETVCSGGVPSQMQVNGASGSGSFLYQWYSRSGIVAAPSGTSTTGWTSLGISNGANTATYAPPSIIASATYACFVTSSCGSNWAIGARQITVTPKTIPTFTQVAAICSGATIAALPTTSNNGVTGTWSPLLNNLATTTYTFTPTLGLCADTTTMTISIFPVVTYGAIPSNVNHVVISQIYGGGGLAASTGPPPVSAAIYKNDFVELFNPTNASISLNDYSLQYASASGVDWGKVNLLGTIASGGYFLIQLFSDTAGFGVSLPTPDFVPSSNAINMANDSGKIALINNQNTITSGISYPPQVSIIDFVGYGVANSAEANAAAPQLTRILANFRNGLGGQDTDVNATDFTAKTPNPRNSATLPQANQSFCVSGTPNVMTVNGASGSGSFLYQWYSRSGIVAAPVGASTAGWTSLGTSNGANTNIYTPPAVITSSTTYACFVTPSGTPTCGSGGWASGVRQITVTPLIGFVNLQFPASGSICANGTYDVFGQIYVAGITEVPFAGPGIVAELGFSTSNTNPSTWTNWTASTFNTQVGNNDEYKATLSGLSAGNYYYAFRYSLNGCPYKYGGINGIWNNDSGVLTVYGTPTTATAGPDQTVCEGTTITLAANSPTVGIGQWSIISGFGGFVTTPSSPISIFTGTINSTYTLRWTTSNGTCANTSDDVVIRINGINWANTQWPPSASICSNGSLPVFGQIFVAGLTEPAGTGAGIVAELGYSSTNTNPNTWINWIPAVINPTPLLTNNNDEYMATLSGLPAGTYYYAFRYLLNGCPYKYGGNLNGIWSGTNNVTGGFWDGTNTVSGVLTVNQPTVAISGITTICSGSSTTLTASGANTYLWSNGLGTSTSINVSPTNSTTYTVTGTDSNNCTNTANINITVNPKPISTLIYHD